MFYFQLCPFPAIQVEEEAWLNSKERRLRLHSYSLTWSKYASLEEFSTFKACENNPNWYVTYFMYTNKFLGHSEANNDAKGI